MHGRAGVRGGAAAAQTDAEHDANNVEAAELFLKLATPAAAPPSGDSRGSASGADADPHALYGTGGGQGQRPTSTMNAAFVKEHPVTAASMGMVLVLFLAGLVAREGMGERVTLILANTVRPCRRPSRGSRSAASPLPRHRRARHKTSDTKFRDGRDPGPGTVPPPPRPHPRHRATHATALISTCPTPAARWA